MTGVILAGGLGTRLRAALPETPKTIAPVGGVPFIRWLLKQLVRAAATRIILCTGYRADQVEQAVGHHFADAPVVYSREEEPLGTAGALANAWRSYGGDGPWLVMNGDSYLDIDLRTVLVDHINARAAVTVAVTPGPHRGTYGRILWSVQRYAIGFDPAATSRPESCWINAGVYAMSPVFLDSLPRRRPLCLDHDVFPRWIRRGIHVLPCFGKFVDIGTPQSYLLAGTLLKSGS